MNKKVLVIVILLILGAAGYFGYTKFMGKSLPGTSSESGGMKSLKDLLSAGVAQKCTFATTSESGSSEGTTYVSGGKVRGDFTTTTSGKTTISHMISDGKTSYVWTEGEKNGFKMTIPESTTEPSTGNADSSTSTSSEADLNQKADYKCSGWVADTSYFTPPANVTFTDFSQIYNPASPQTGKTTGTSSQCSYCNSLTGDDKTQCLTALKCN